MSISKKIALGLVILGVASFAIAGCGDNKNDSPTPKSPSTTTVKDPYDPNVIPKRKTVTAKPDGKFVFGDQEASIYKIHKFTQNISISKIFANSKHVYAVSTSNKKILDLSISNGRVSKTTDVTTEDFPMSGTFDANEKGFLWHGKNYKLSWYDNTKAKIDINKTKNNIITFALRKNSKATNEVWYQANDTIAKATLVNGNLQTPTTVISHATLKTTTQNLQNTTSIKLTGVDDKSLYFIYITRPNNKQTSNLLMTDLKGQRMYNLASEVGGMDTFWIVTNNYVLNLGRRGQGVIYKKATGEKISDIELPNNIRPNAGTFAEGNDIYITDSSKNLYRIDL